MRGQCAATGSLWGNHVSAEKAEGTQLHAEATPGLAGLAFQELANLL